MSKKKPEKDYLDKLSKANYNKAKRATMSGKQAKNPNDIFDRIGGFFSKSKAREVKTIDKSTANGIKNGNIIKEYKKNNDKVKRKLR